MNSRIIGFKAVEDDETTADLTYGVFLSSFCGVGVIINGIMISVFLIENKRKNSHHVTYLNLSISDFLWALFGACIEGPGMLFYKVSISELRFEIMYFELYNWKICLP